MSLCSHVTITGADDQTDISEMLLLSKAFPFVEWGILVSQRQEGAPRFPSRGWINDFAHVAKAEWLRVSTHVCGTWVRELLRGDLDWGHLPPILDVSARVQINTHAEEHVSKLQMITVLGDLPNKQFIFQFDGVNDHLAMAAHGMGIRTAALFDTSHGAGVLPGSWPSQLTTMRCGYAGGLGPDNVVEQLARIDGLCSRHFWIDMEGRVRTGEKLDLTKVRAVLEAVAPQIPQVYTSNPS